MSDTLWELWMLCGTEVISIYGNEDGGQDGVHICLWSLQTDKAAVRGLRGSETNTCLFCNIF